MLMDSLIDMVLRIEEKRKKKNEYSRKWHIRNRERRLEAAKKWYKENKEHIRERTKKFREENWDIFLEHNRMYRKTEMGKAYVQRSGIARRTRMNGAINTLTAEEWKDILKQYDYKCAYCGKSILDLPDGLVRDHVIPISRGGDNTKENVVLACRSCNASKGVRLVSEVLNE